MRLLDPDPISSTLSNRCLQPLQPSPPFARKKPSLLELCDYGGDLLSLVLVVLGSSPLITIVPPIPDQLCRSEWLWLEVRRRGHQDFGFAIRDDDRHGSSLVVDFLHSNKSNDRLLKKLKIMFLSVNILLNNAEDKQIRNLAVKQWLNELIEATYDVEDMMDEIETEDLRYKLEGGGRSSISHEKQHKS
ncbi:hypothetical protein TIFTF001_016661 [Ficus carica]|uniref:Disease resistance N-terminal domain-containing protein n=1 Tax=Ficus carica TaxID=3494 RepID=A0AA88DA22_FICCA|nr:hypothetical protein TIFTF001_016661 [Ficus carica]